MTAVRIPSHSSSFKAAVASKSTTFGNALGGLSSRRRQRGTFQLLLLFFFKGQKVLNLHGVLFTDGNVISMLFWASLAGITFCLAFSCSF